MRVGDWLYIPEQGAQNRPLADGPFNALDPAKVFYFIDTTSW